MVFKRKPILKNLSQGSRLKFVRNLYDVTQQELGEYLGYGSHSRSLISRYESNGRGIKEDTLSLIAEYLHINPQMLKQFKFIEKNEQIYYMLWLEELFPDLTIPFDSLKAFAEDTNKIDEWKKMNDKYKSKEIDCFKYWKWKLEIFSIDNNLDRNNQ